MGNKVNIIALYKTFSGHEFVKQSIESIYDSVKKIYFVHSFVDWLGNEGTNDTIVPINDWKDKNDKKGKIEQIYGNYPNQSEQYNVGFEAIRQNENYDYIMLIDTDEVWSYDHLDSAIDMLEMDNGRHSGFRTRMFTYIKKLNFIVWPPEPCSPLVFVNNNIDRIHGVRGNSLQNTIIMQNIYFHHFTLIRNNEDEIFHKIALSNKGDNMKPVDIDKWRKEVWNNIPKVENFHMTKGYEHCWQGLRTVPNNFLPETMRRAVQ